MGRVRRTTGLGGIGNQVSACRCVWNFSPALAFLTNGKRSKAMRRSLTSAVALVGAGMGVAAQSARIEPDAKAAEISTWRWTWT